MSRQLTAEQNAYVELLGARMAALEAKMKAVKRLPLESTHEETGLPAWQVSCMLIECYGITAHDITVLTS